jgi:hypothetical protein
MAIYFLPHYLRDKKVQVKKLNFFLLQRVARGRLRGGGERRIPADPSQQSQPQRSAIYLLYLYQAVPSFRAVLLKVVLQKCGYRQVPGTLICATQGTVTNGLCRTDTYGTQIAKLNGEY